MNTQEIVGLGVIGLGIIAGLTNAIFRGRVIYHGISISSSIILIIIGAKIAGYW